MKNSLERLDYLINVRLNPDNTTGLDASCRILNIWINETVRESDIIRTCLLRKSVDIPDEKAFVLLVQQCQAAVIRLTDTIYGYKLQDPTSLFICLYDSILKLLNTLLHYIENGYPNYFNREEKVPDMILHAIQSQIKKELKALAKTAFSAADCRLKQMLCAHIQKFNQSSSQDFISYKRIAYIKEVMAELKNMPVPSECPNQYIMDFLIYMNFNTLDLLNYYVNDIKSYIASCKTPALKREVLLSALKKINQLQVKPGIAFRPQMTPLKEQISTWLSEEIQFLEKQHAQFTESYGQSQPVEGKEEEKLHTSLSVQQLALFIRAAKDTGMLTNKNQTALLKTLAKIFCTPQTESISAESLRIKYYTAEPAAIQSVKDLLLDMFKKLQSY